MFPFPSRLRRSRSHHRYAINTDSTDWTVAENQISKAGHKASTVVSVKSSGDKKRKLGDASDDGGDEKRRKVKGDKKTRRSMKKAKR